MNVCKELHEFARTLTRFRFPFNGADIPENGIYLLFESGERAHGGERIVRVGTHTGENQLGSRLSQHFIMENKDRSIFRKNIGRALLSRDKDPFISAWEIDLTSRASKDARAGTIDLVYQKEIERQVSDYMRGNFSFVFIGINDRHERLTLESKIISTVSLCEQCAPSERWLGNFSPKEKICESGLWLVNELYKTPLDENTFKRLAEHAK